MASVKPTPETTESAMPTPDQPRPDAAGMTTARTVIASRLDLCPAGGGSVVTETMTAEEFTAMQAKQTTRKYRNEPCEEDGFRFDSKAERARYRELKLMVTAGEIHGLVLQPRFDLIVRGTKVGTYIADFEYVRGHGERIIEDVKSPASRTPVYRLKRKLVRAIHGIDIVEVTR